LPLPLLDTTDNAFALAKLPIVSDFAFISSTLLEELKLTALPSGIFVPVPNCTVPAPMLVVPAYVLVPLNLNIPAPDFVKFRPLITPLTPTLLPSTTLLVVVIVMSPPPLIPFETVPPSLFDVDDTAEAILISLALILIAPPRALYALFDALYPVALIVPALVELTLPFTALNVILPLT
jgi:hypothetical protein